MFYLMVDPMPRKWSLALTASDSSRLLASAEFSCPNDDLKVPGKVLKKLLYSSAGMSDILISGGNPMKYVEEVHYRLSLGYSPDISPEIVSKPLLKKLTDLRVKAPFHIPALISSINVFQKLFPSAVHKVYSDENFFNKLPVSEKFYAISSDISSKLGIMRTGVHGIFHAHAAKIASGSKVLSWCLDKRISVCGINDGVPRLVSGGLTPLEGILGETVCGDIDAGIIFYLMEKEKISTGKMDHILKEQCGFRGLTGMNRGLTEIFNKRATSVKCDLVLKVLEYQVLKYSGRAFALMNGVSDLVIGGCHAEAVFPFIYQMLKNLSFIGVQLKPLTGGKREQMTVLSTGDSRVNVLLSTENFLELMR